MSAETEPKATDTSTHGMLTTFGFVVAPLTLGLTGLLYIAGWAFRRGQTEPFGLDSNQFESTFQNTLAVGYLPLGTTIIVLGSVFYIYWAKRRRSKPARKMPAPEQEGFLLRVYGFALVAFWLLAIAAFVGSIAGAGSTYLTVRDVVRGCERVCYEYRLERGAIEGIILIADSKRSAIYTPNGVIVVDTSKIRRVRRVGVAYEPESRGEAAVLTANSSGSAN